VERKEIALKQFMQVSCWPSTKRTFSNEINLESELKSKDTSSGSNLKSKDLLRKQFEIKRFALKTIWNRKIQVKEAI
jgi:hypothetical protein